MASPRSEPPRCFDDDPPGLSLLTPEECLPSAGPGCPDCGPEAELERFTIDHVRGYGAGPTITRCAECGIDLRTE